MNNCQPPRLCAYWLGYCPTIKDQPTPALKDTPKYIDVVVLAFALVRGNNSIDTSFLLTAPYTEKSIIDAVKTLQQQGTKVMLSVGGWAGNCWGNVTDESALADNIMKVVTAWNLDGVDIDYEGDNEFGEKDPNSKKYPLCPDSSHTINWQTLFKLLRKKLGPKGLLTAVTANRTFYESSLAELSWVFTMDYGNNSFYTNLANTYLQNNPGTSFVPYVLGVSCIQPPYWGHMTIEQVKDACSVKAPVGPLSMQFWDLSEDVKAYTGKANGAYLKVVEEHLEKR